MLDIRQTVRDDMERTFQAIGAKLDDLAASQRRFDEHAAQVVQHVNETTARSSQRMDEGDQRDRRSDRRRCSTPRRRRSPPPSRTSRRRSLEHTGTLLQKLESSETRVTDRLLALEARINDDQGTKIANLEATIGRIGAGFDDAMVAINQRMLELENRLLEVGDQFDALAETVSRIDQDAIDELKSQMSQRGRRGDARAHRARSRRRQSTEDKFDKQAIRMSEIETMLIDEMDVGTAVQLERLDELERADRAARPGEVHRRASAATACAGTLPLDVRRRRRRASTALGAARSQLAQDPTYSSH